jgi:hypothetical protein
VPSAERPGSQIPTWLLQPPLHRRTQRDPWPEEQVASLPPAIVVQHPVKTKPFKLVAVALANKMARIAFAIMRGKTSYSADPA